MMPVVKSLTKVDLKSHKKKKITDRLNKAVSTYAYLQKNTEKKNIMAYLQNMTLAITQVTHKTSKAVIIATREAKNPVKMQEYNNKHQEQLNQY